MASSSAQHTRRKYYQSEFFCKQVVPFLLGGYLMSHPTYTELSFKLPKARQPMRHMTLSNIEAVFKLYDPGDIERLDVGGASQVHQARFTPSPAMLADDGCQITFDRDFIMDVDFEAKDRPPGCPCGESKRSCDTCFTGVILPRALALKKLLEDKGLVYEEDFFLFFSGGRGFHLWITHRYVKAYTPEEREAFLKKLEKEGGFKIREADRNVTRGEKSLIRLPFSLHNVTLLPCVPLLMVSSLDELRDFPQRLKDLEAMKRFLAQRGG